MVEATLLSRASPLTLTASFAACRLLGGASAAAAETGAFTALCMSDWGERMGFVFAAIGVDVGLAVSLGAAVGGLPCLTSQGEGVARSRRRPPSAARESA